MNLRAENNVMEEKRAGVITIVRRSKSEKAVFLAEPGT